VKTSVKANEILFVLNDWDYNCKNKNVQEIHL
jgi:hypothetical protein